NTYYSQAGYSLSDRSPRTGAYAWLCNLKCPVLQPGDSVVVAIGALAQVAHGVGFALGVEVGHGGLDHLATAGRNVQRDDLGDIQVIPVLIRDRLRFGIGQLCDKGQAGNPEQGCHGRLLHVEAGPHRMAGHCLGNKRGCQGGRSQRGPSHSSKGANIDRWAAGPAEGGAAMSPDTRKGWRRLEKYCPGRWILTGWVTVRGSLVIVPRPVLAVLPHFVVAGQRLR